MPQVQDEPPTGANVSGEVVMDISDSYAVINKLKLKNLGLNRDGNLETSGNLKPRLSLEPQLPCQFAKTRENCSLCYIFVTWWVNRSPASSECDFRE